MQDGLLLVYKFIFFNNGVLLQWGQSTHSANVTKNTFTLPTAYTNLRFVALATHLISTATIGDINHIVSTQRNSTTSLSTIIPEVNNVMIAWWCCVGN